MKLYTTADQTEHLIELGFKRPVGVGYNYSIGELIALLDSIKVRTDIGIGLAKPTCVNTNKGYIRWDWELIDNLYNACVELKNKGVI